MTFSFLSKVGMPEHVPKDLNSCMEYYCNVSQPTPHCALKDAQCVRSICKRFSETLGFNGLLEFLNENFDRLDKHTYKLFDQFDYRPPPQNDSDWIVDYQNFCKKPFD